MTTRQAIDRFIEKYHLIEIDDYDMTVQSDEVIPARFEDYPYDREVRVTNKGYKDMIVYMYPGTPKLQSITIHSFKDFTFVVFDYGCQRYFYHPTDMQLNKLWNFLTYCDLIVSPYRTSLKDSFHTQYMTDEYLRILERAM